VGEDDGVPLLFQGRDPLVQAKVFFGDSYRPPSSFLLVPPPRLCGIVRGWVIPYVWAIIV